jgi:hypothetical protein
MNARRGFQRLFLVLGIFYYLAGGLWLYDRWTNRISAQRFELTRCLDAVRDPGDSVLRITDADCRENHPPANEWPATISLVIFPALLYGAWRILAWIGRGFKTEGRISN